MKTNSITVTKNELFFMPSLGIYLVFSILTLTFYYQYFGSSVYNAVVYFCILLAVVGELVSGKMTIKSLIGMVIFVFMTLLIYRVGSISIAITFIYIYCSRNISFKKIAKMYMILTACTLLFVVLSSYLGIIENYVAVQSGGRVREFLGFRYALYPSLFLFSVIAAYTYLNYKKMKLGHAVVLLLIVAWFFSKTNSRISSFLSVVLILAAFAFKKEKVKALEFKPIAFLQIFSFFICAVSSLYLTVTYTGSGWMEKLNQFLNKRLYYGQVSIIENGVSLWGQRLTWVGNGLDIYGEVVDETYNWVDNLYQQLMQKYGLVFLILFLVIMTLGMYMLYKRGESYLLLILTLFAIKAMIDSSAFNLYYNIFWIPVGSALINSYKYYGNREKNTKRKHIRAST